MSVNRWQISALVALVAGPGLAMSTASAQAEQTSAREPELAPGIPGLKMADVRGHNHLWRELEELQEWEVSDRITIADFRSKSIEKTAEYLGFTGPAAESFHQASLAAVMGLRVASRASHEATNTLASSEAIYKAGLEAAVARMKELLKDEPRHHAFEAKLKLWLLKLALGPSDVEERREAKAAGSAETTAGKPSADVPSKPHR